jgi:hypothetical protein
MKYADLKLEIESILSKDFTEFSKYNVSDKFDILVISYIRNAVDSNPEWFENEEIVRFISSLLESFSGLVVEVLTDITSNHEEEIDAITAEYEYKLDREICTVTDMAQDLSASEKEIEDIRSELNKELEQKDDIILKHEEEIESLKLKIDSFTPTNLSVVKINDCHDFI